MRCASAPNGTSCGRRWNRAGAQDDGAFWRRFSLRATHRGRHRYTSTVTDCLAPTDRSPDPLEERLTRALPRLRAHLARPRSRVPGVDLEDVTQEVLARALHYRGSFDGARSLWPWLRRVADRVVCDQREAGARRPDPLEECDPVARERPVALDERDELVRLLGGLSPREREVLLRFHHRGESVRTIAGALNLPEGTVKSHLSRARRRLAQSADTEPRS